MLPPNKITDLEAKFKEDYIQLSWTAPGNVLDKEKVSLILHLEILHTLAFIC